MLQLVIGAIAGFALNEYLHKSKGDIKDEPEIKVYGITIPYFKTMDETRIVLDQVRRYLDLYRELTVNDFYNLCGINPAKKYEDNYRIWSSDRIPFRITKTVNGNYAIWPTEKPKVSYKYYKKRREPHVPGNQDNPL